MTEVQIEMIEDLVVSIGETTIEDRPVETIEDLVIAVQGDTMTEEMGIVVLMIDEGAGGGLMILVVREDLDVEMEEDLVEIAMMTAEMTDSEVVVGTDTMTGVGWMIEMVYIVINVILMHYMHTYFLFPEVDMRQVSFCCL